MFGLCDIILKGSISKNHLGIAREFEFLCHSAMPKVSLSHFLLDEVLVKAGGTLAI